MEVSMAFPLIPFAAGIALGSLATYGATDKSLQRRVVKATDAALAQVRAGAKKVAEMVPRLKRDAVQGTEAAVEAVEEGAEQAKAVVDEAMQKAKRTASEAADSVKKSAES
jgi:methyl-accepting chemotaxis protein